MVDQTNALIRHLIQGSLLKSADFGRFLIASKVFVLQVELCEIPLEAGAPRRDD